MDWLQFQEISSKCLITPLHFLLQQMVSHNVRMNIKAKKKHVEILFQNVRWVLCESFSGARNFPLTDHLQTVHAVLRIACVYYTKKNWYNKRRSFVRSEENPVVDPRLKWHNKIT